jgi:hypothetical protein
LPILLCFILSALMSRGPKARMVEGGSGSFSCLPLMVSHLRFRVACCARAASLEPLITIFGQLLWQGFDSVPDSP